VTASVSTPLRVDLTGGHTDIREFYEQFGGVGLNFAITSRTTVFDAEADWGGAPGFALVAQQDSPNFPDRLLFHAERIAGVSAYRKLVVSNTGPMGCGLGTSGALAVALVAALDPSLATADVVRIAQNAETAAGNTCGWQDHIASAFGGINAIEIPTAGQYDRHGVDAAGFSAISSQLTVWLKPSERSSGGVVDALVARLRAGDAAVRSSMERLVDVYPTLLSAVTSGQLDSLIEAVREVHAAQAGLGEHVVPAVVRTIVHDIERRFRGAAKLQGGGGSGAALLTVVPADESPALHAAMTGWGYVPLAFTFEDCGLVVES
jgi:galactokinase/mevalonate kinase-like predicted kinase